MKQYNRAKQRQLDLISLNIYTNLEIDGKRRCTLRKIEGRSLLNDREDNGSRPDHPGRSSEEARGQAHQHQYVNAQETACEPGFFAESCELSWARSGHKNMEEEPGEAA